MSLPFAHMPASAGAAVFALRVLLGTSAAWLLAAALTLVLRRSPASLRHRIWSMSMAAACAIPPLVALAPQWEIAHLRPTAVGAAERAQAAAGPHPQAVVRMPAVTGIETEPEGTKVSPSKPTHVIDEAALPPAATPPAIAPPRSRAAAAQPQAVDRNIPWSGYIAGLWLIVALWLLARQAVSLFIAVAVVRRAQLVVEGAAVRELKRLASRFNLAAPAALRRSDEVRTPICVGCVWPCIVLPVEYAHWDQEQLAAALTHELAHVVRRDVAWQMLARIACAAWWFHPLAWIAAWRMRVERELACDDWVLRGGESSTRYARWVVDMAASLAGRSRPAERVGVAMVRPHGFHTRLSAILDSRRRRAPLSRRTTLLLAMAAGALLAPLAVLNPFASRHAIAAVPPPATQPVPPATQPAVPAATQPADDSEGPQRSLLVKFVDAVTGGPVPGVKGNYWSDHQRSRNDQRYTSDENGQTTFTYSADARSVGFFLHKESFVEGLVTIGGEFGATPLSDTFTLRMQHGQTVGGIVQDEQGNGIPDVKVSVSFEITPAEKAGGLVRSSGSAKTDAEGRWTYGGAPPHPTEISVFTAHPDFIMSSFDHRLGSGRFADLLAKKLVTVVQRGLSVSGTVLDSDGKSVPRAQIANGGFGLISGTISDEQGHFELRGVEPGPRVILVKAEGFAPQLKELTAAPALPPVQFHLDKGHVLRARVVDPKGQPVPSATVIVERWRTIPRLDIYMTADSGSRFIWNNAPADEVELLAYCSRGLFQSREVTAVAGEKEVVITLQPQVAVRSQFQGNVIDDETGKPIEAFGVQISATQGKIGHEADRRGHNGRYDIGQLFDADTFQIRISADGYLPVDSPPLRSHDGPIQFDARLKKGGGIAGSILTPDGKPAAGADVVLVEHLAPTVEDGQLIAGTKTANVSTVTDAGGHFMLPQRTGKLKLMLVHDSGWSYITIAADASLQDLRLRAWCKLDGILMKGDKPWPGQTIELRPTMKFGEPIPERQNFSYSTTTDTDGRFKIERVVDGTCEIGRQLVVGEMRIVNTTHGMPLNLKPGESKAGIHIGGTGRPVIAHIIVGEDLKARGLIPVDGWLSLTPPPGFVRPPNWDALNDADRKRLRQEYEQSDVYQQYDRRPKRFGALVQPDGSLRIDDVPAGDYTLDVSVLRRSPDDPTFLRAEAKAEMKITVLEMPGGRSDEPLDAGSLALGIVQRPKVGEMAPQFEPADFQKGHIKLSDYRGKYVLLDFWATWCGPCIAEFKHMEKLNQAYANDPRLVMIGVSVDDRADDPAKYLLSHKLPWPQAYGGPTAWTTFGIGAIPSVWLIGPDGRIIAKEIPEEDLDGVVQKALLSASKTSTNG